MPGKLKGAYGRGAAFEREVAAAFEGFGYDVTRSPKSGGVKDLTALRSIAKGEALFIQCKKAGALPPEEWNGLFAKALHHDALPLCAARAPRGPLRLYLLLSPKATDHTGPNPWRLWELS